MPRRSAGLLLYRWRDGELEVLIGHMGGPFWARRDEGAWSIPKGEFLEDETPLAVALREFEEELGSPAPPGTPAALGDFRQSGKVVTVFALEGDFDAAAARSNHDTVQWPPGSGRFRSFPEIDRAEWVTLDRARPRLVRGQVPALEALARLAAPPAAP